jgi:hypothetical protein
MWARVIEFAIGCWLAMSPFIFGHGADEVLLWTVDLTAATIVMSLALASYWHPLRHAHLATIAVGLALVVVGRFLNPTPVPPAGQNQIVVGLLLLMFALVPNHASMPPNHWLPEAPRHTH